MGTIYHIHENPRQWPVIRDDLTTNEPYGSYPVCKIEYGIADHTPRDNQNLTLYVRKTIYENLLNGNYRFSMNTPSDPKTIQITDQSGAVIPPVLTGICY